jgi:hypothetical protein
MLVKQLKNYLSGLKDNANVMVYVGKTDEVRHLVFNDIDRDHSGDIIIDAEYKIPEQLK